MKPPKQTMRKPYIQQVRIDVATQDRLDWALVCVHHLYPEAKLSKSLLMRRALAQYVSYLENITTTTSGGKMNHPAIDSEAAQLLSFKNDQLGLGDSFPEGELFDSEGKIVPFRKLLQDARKTSMKKFLTTGD